MDQYENFVCELRYCPSCGTDIFCRTDSNNETLYFISEAMERQIQACPQCQLDLIGVPIHVLHMQSKPSGKEKPRRARNQASLKQLTDAAFEKNPQIFPTKGTAKRALQTIGEVFIDLLSNDVDVRWSGIGSFRVHERKSRKGRNPVTGETMRIPAKKVVKFLPSKSLREKVER